MSPLTTLNHSQSLPTTPPHHKQYTALALTPLLICNAIPQFNRTASYTASWTSYAFPAKAISLQAHTRPQNEVQERAPHKL